MNKLYYGDNLEIMQRMKKDSVDLIYLDPPFKSDKNYNLMYKNMTGMPVSEQVEAFCDTWQLDADKERRANEMPVLMRKYGVPDYYVEFWRLWIKALHETQPHLLAYLIYMVERLLHMKSLLRPHGSIYLHCDPTASHYIKIMMDGIFGHNNFRNEIIWCYKTGGRAKKFFPKKHDVIFWYSSSSKYKFNYDAVAIPRDFSTMHEPVFTDKDGRKYQRNIKNKKEYRYYVDKGVLPNDYWTDIQALNPSSKERLGYPTQKPIALLERIIKASSKKGDVIFDPFCGCGTTVYAALKNERKWIGCDIAILSIKLIKHVLEERYKQKEGVNFEIDGIPASVEQAQHLFKRDPFQFEHWLVEKVGGFPTKKTADRGIDGRLYFETRDGLRDLVMSVKGGNIRPTDVRDLRGVLEREENAEMAGFLSIKEPTKSMKDEAARAGTYEYNGIHYDRMQFLTVKDVMEDKKRFHTPSAVGVKGATLELNLGLPN